MGISKILKYIFISILWLSFLVGFTQNEFDSSEEMADKAAVLFQDEQYLAAFPLYSQLLSLDRNNPELSYRFGVCLLYSDRRDTYAPITHLKKAINQISDPNLYYHLGFAYHINYNFPAAISFYEDYKSKAGRKVSPNFEVDRKIEMCRNGMHMMKSVKDLFVLEKNEVSRDEFFRSYNLHGYGGKMIRKPEDFLSKEDQRKTSNDFIFFNSKANDVYYSAYSKQNKDQKDIYKRTKLLEGGWSEPERLPDIINTPYDDDYVVMMPDGKTMYFSSKGHNTIGGFDIFKSVYNDQSKTWSVPENVNFPFNTPVDDILFVSDTSEATAWFASVRSSVDDQIMVYKVGIIKRPDGSDDLAAIYAKNKMLTEEDLRNIKNRASLDVNISEEEFDEIPVVDHIAAAQILHQQNEEKIAADIEKKKQEQVVIDSAKVVISRFEKNMDAFDSVRQYALSLASNKKLESHRLREEVKQNMKLAASSNDKEGLTKLINTSNFAIGKAEQLDYIAANLETFAKETQRKIERQVQNFATLNRQYGDAENAVINGDLDRAQATILAMKSIQLNAPKVMELEAEMPINEGENTNRQFPLEIQEAIVYQAFKLESETPQLEIVALSAEFESYIPTKEVKEDLITETTAFSNNPSKKLEEYLIVLEQQQPSILVLIGEKEGHIEEMIKSFEQLEDAEKSEALQAVNQEQEELNNYQNAKAWSDKMIAKTRSDLQNTQMSSVDPDEKFEAYQAMALELEKGYDFSKNTFNSDELNLQNNQSITTTETSSSTLKATTSIYILNSNGEIAKQIIDSDHLIPSSQLNFSAGNEDFLRAQSLQMIAAVRKQNKLNSFGQRKLQNRISTLETESQQSFTKANQLLVSTKNAPVSTQQDLLAQTNKEFNNLQNKVTEIKTLNLVDQQLESANNDAARISVKMTQQFELLETELKNKKFNNIEQIYIGIERDYNNYKVITDFSSDFNMETGALIKPVTTSSVLIPTYQITSQGDLVKSFGQASEDWNNVEEFMEDANNSEVQQNLVLSPNVDLSSSEERFTRIFSPSTQKEAENLYIIKPRFNSFVQSSTNSLIQNSLNQINSLVGETEFLLAKRNQVNQYYLKQLEEANKFEQQSITKISSANLSTPEIAEANSLSLESKKGFYKASVAASFIKQYDQQIVQQSLLLDEAAETVQTMQSDLDNNLPDEALLKNVQLQRKMAALNKTEIDDSAYNFFVNELFVPIPEIFSESENQEFLITNGQVQRNDQVILNQFFYQNTPQVGVDILELPSLSIGKPDIIEEETKHTTEVLATYPSNNPTTTHPSLNIPNTTNSKSNGNETSSVNGSGSVSTGLVISNPVENTSEGIVKDINLKAINAKEFKTDDDIRDALGSLNLYAQAHMTEVDLMQKRLAISAENKLNTSNKFSLQLETLNDPISRRPVNDSAKSYLYQALALKAVSDEYQTYLDGERNIQDQITQYSFDIEKDLEKNNLNAATVKFEKMQTEISSFGEEPEIKLLDIQLQLIGQINSSKIKMDSAFALSMDLANQSVKLLSEASEERQEAEGKRNAFKRREALKAAESKEIEATKIQNESEKALAFGNSMHEEHQIFLSLASIEAEVNALSKAPVQQSQMVVNQELVFEGIDNRKSEVLGRPMNTAISQVTEPNTNKNPLGTNDDLHVYERENFKAEMLTEELELIKREIALLVQSQNTNLTPKEAYLVEKKVDILRQKADSLEYEANRVFDLADRILETLSEEEQKEAKKSNRDFNSYLSDLKDKIEVLLSEASSLKQRAQRSNNIQTREDLFQQAKDKEEVAMYLILEEFEVIAQKNKTRYRKNQLLLEQLMMDLASTKERELMRNIFAQIDDYFAQAQLKRAKANQPGISFSLKKVLLQDAYSLEMKALDLQQQTKTMLEKHDMKSMMAYQVVTEEEQELAKNNLVVNPLRNEGEAAISKNNIVPSDIPPSQITIKSQGTNLIKEDAEESIANNSGVNSQVQKPPINSQESISAGQEVEYISSVDDGIVYRVQFTALKELKNESFFNRVSDISAEKVTGTDFIRYFSGNFNEMDAAIIRRNALRSSGYQDAFIRSWKNGEAVTLLSLREDEGSTDSPINSVAAVRRTSVGNIDFSATNISSLPGVYYTVQVGVYSRPRTSAMIFGIKPLYHKRMQNGYWIYYSGIFNSIADATVKKDEIVEQGVKDAFVVAFSNGNSVGLAEARQQINRGVDSPNDEDIVILEDASLQIDNQWDMSQQARIISNSNLEYKVQVGVYSNPIDLNWIASQLDDDYSVDSYQNSNGKYVYSIGNFNDNADARMLLKEIQEIIPDAFLVGFQDGNKKYIR
ncbi:SPOR domain-containing protein [Lentimicrobium sp. S6]|uniref:SPOR domain-containing protein n=1 Tax=Lentimicrobium sp. S6 TaxID=2735872 RepID=UPI001554AC91|nr:SPOR domain-containing protein [Lentimicrobium sp. S6]NPD45008.1 hypothetical protein [Lentimicrobium sp. S6]